MSTHYGLEFVLTHDPTEVEAVVEKLQKKRNRVETQLRASESKLKALQAEFKAEPSAELLAELNGVFARLYRLRMKS